MNRSQSTALNDPLNEVLNEVLDSLVNDLVILNKHLMGSFNRSFQGNYSLGDSTSNPSALEQPVETPSESELFGDLE